MPQAQAQTRRTPREQAEFDYRVSGAFSNRRIECMEGHAAATNRNDRYTAEYCMTLMELSADNDRTPNDRPDRNLNAPYGSMMRDRGFAPNNTAANMALDTLARGSRLPAARSTTGPGRFAPQDRNNTIPQGYNGTPLVLMPGVAWDAGFSSTVQQERRDGQRQPAPTRSIEDLRQEAARCFTNAGQYIANCFEGGREQALHYLNRTRGQDNSRAPR